MKYAWHKEWRCVIKALSSFWSWGKGQLISKRNFSVFNSPKKGFWNFDFCPSQLGQKIFVHFLGELKKTKSPFEITDLYFLQDKSSFYASDIGLSGTVLWSFFNLSHNFKKLHVNNINFGFLRMDIEKTMKTTVTGAIVSIV